MAKQPNAYLFSNHLRPISVALKPDGSRQIVRAYRLRAGLGGVFPEFVKSDAFAVHRRVTSEQNADGTYKLSAREWTVTHIPTGAEVPPRGISGEFKTYADNPYFAVIRAARMLRFKGPDAFAAGVRRFEQLHQQREQRIAA